MSVSLSGGEAETSPHPASEKCNEEEEKNKKDQEQKALSVGGPTPGPGSGELDVDGNESASAEDRGGMLSDAEVEKLGRERPALLPNWWVEIAFCFSVVMSQVMAVRLLTVFSLLPSSFWSWAGFRFLIVFFVNVGIFHFWVQRDHPHVGCDI